MGLMAELGEGPIGLDTAIFIYFIEEHPRYLPAVLPVFTGLRILQTADFLPARDPESTA